MPSLPRLILKHAAESPEGSLLCPNVLLHLGKRDAVDQALSRLARSGRLNRVCQGVYVRPIETRFGPRPPSVDKVIDSLAVLWGETIVPCGGAAANALGLSTPGAGPVRLPHLRPKPHAEARRGHDTPAPRPKVAACSTASGGW